MEKLKLGSRVLSAILAVFITSAGAAAVTILGRSNELGGTFETGPIGQAILSGSLEPKYYLGATVVSSFWVQNGVGAPISVHLQLTLSRPGINAADTKVFIAGNSPVVISCDSMNCTYVGTTWPIGIGETGQCDISLTVLTSATFDWEVVAVWTMAG